MEIKGCYLLPQLARVRNPIELGGDRFDQGRWHLHIFADFKGGLLFGHQEQCRDGEPSWCFHRQSCMGVSLKDPCNLLAVPFQEVCLE